MFIATLVKILDEAAIKEFAAKVRGKVILPEDPEYNNERKVYNGMIDKHPGLIVKCVDVSDVIYSVNFERKMIY